MMTWMRPLETSSRPVFDQAGIFAPNSLDSNPASRPMTVLEILTNFQHFLIMTVKGLLTGDIKASNPLLSSIRLGIFTEKIMRVLPFKPRFKNSNDSLQILATKHQNHAPTGIPQAPPHSLSYSWSVPY